MKIKKEILGTVILLFILIVLFLVKTNSNETSFVKNDAEKSYDNLSEATNLIASPDHIVVYITGEVIKPGVYEISENDRLERVVSLAGGFTEKADTHTINLAKKMVDGEMVVVYEQSLDTTQYYGIDIFNYGSPDDILAVDGIGEVICNRIIDYKEQNGIFESFEDLLNVEGIGEQKLKTIQKSLGN